MRPDTNEPPAYIYVEGSDTDALWDKDTCIEIEKCPTSSHLYNLQANKWELDEASYMIDLRAKRNAELDRTDYLMNLDYPISAANIIIIKTYRQTLRDTPNQELLVDRVLPECPEACNK